MAGFFVKPQDPHSPPRTGRRDLPQPVCSKPLLVPMDRLVLPHRHAPTWMAA